MGIKKKSTIKNCQNFIENSMSLNAKNLHRILYVKEFTKLLNGLKKLYVWILAILFMKSYKNSRWMKKYMMKIQEVLQK